MKLNVGCGNKRLAGYTSVDVEAIDGFQVDIVADARNIPLPDGSVEEILAVHVLEHFYRWEVGDVLTEWHRLLQTKGRLVLELPDIAKASRNVLENRSEQMTLWALYGDPGHRNPRMCHHWGWTGATLRPVLGIFGYKDIVEVETQFHPIGRGVRDFRMEAIKHG